MYKYQRSLLISWFILLSLRVEIDIVSFTIRWNVLNWMTFSLKLYLHCKKCISVEKQIKLFDLSNVMSLFVEKEIHCFQSMNHD